MRAEDLSRYRWHTGARLRRVGPDEAVPVLFRDIGPVALQTFLAGRLQRLAGPYTPLLYMRTADFREPFVDHARTGRLAFLRPRAVQPWHSGVDRIFVARASNQAPAGTLGYVPGDADFDAVAAAGPSCVAELREHLGGRRYDQRCEHDREALGRLNEEAAASERRAHPLRQALQSPDRSRSARAREIMAAAGIDDQMLCAAWHHLSERDRRVLVTALDRVDPSSLNVASPPQ